MWQSADWKEKDELKLEMDEIEQEIEIEQET